jgi:UDP-glucose:(heptosyl)LPS alpha-1,3-glucosyltransferase/heptose I phosphotransferase
MMTTQQLISLPVTMQIEGIDMFAHIMQMQGKAYRDVGVRKTIQVNIDGKSYFIKQHFGVGWLEIFKNLLSLKLPILGAITEVTAIRKLGDIGIATTPLVAYGQRGRNPATLQSFVITEDLGDIISLEDLCADWQENPPSSAFKQQLIISIAQLAAKLHGAGICHRDFYLCHLVLKRTELAQGQVDLILIDLHRMLLGQSSHGSTVMKDIAGLFFSAMDCGLNADDFILFKHYYLSQTDVFWMNVEQRANKLYAKFKSSKFQKRLANERLAVKL